MARRLGMSWQQKASPLSGLARGIDTEAHQGALAAAGETVPVQASRLKMLYPSAKRELVEVMVALGPVNLCELPIGTPLIVGTFPALCAVRRTSLNGKTRGVTA
jgi:DNA processing protein